MSINKTIVLTGGGTGGHIYPNLALVPFLKRYFGKIHYIASANLADEKIVKDYNPEIIFHAIPSVKLERRITLSNLAIPFKLHHAVRCASQLLGEIKPDVIFSKGGFAALPVTIAAGKKIPYVIHESDVSLGLANRLALQKSQAVLSSFDLAKKYGKKCVCTGAPLRRELYCGNTQNVENAFKGRKRGLKTLLVLGGSLGASAINAVIFNAAARLCERFNVIHAVGINKDNFVGNSPENYLRLPYINNISDYYAHADLVVSRGGANTLFELTALAKPALVIPLPKGASRGDQLLNARFFKDKNCIKILEQERLSPSTLLDSLALLERDSEALISACKKAICIDGTSEIVMRILMAAGIN